MKYFKLTNSTNLKEVGYFIQTRGLPNGYTYKWFEQENSMTKLNIFELPNFIPDLIWELEDNAKLTDIISASNIRGKGFLMNKKAKELFVRYNIIEHKFHKSIVIYKGTNYEYFYLQLVKDDLNDIDFNKSLFCISNFVGKKVKSVSFSSYQEIISLQNNLDFGLIILAEKLKLNFYFYDLLFFPRVRNEIFISEIMLGHILECNISGLEFSEQDIVT
ncbi:MAG: hypothetical protein RIF34_06590 [Candidatus Kapaibacterium sp.]